MEDDGGMPSVPKERSRKGPVAEQCADNPLTIIVTAAVSVWRAHVYGAAWLLLTNTLQPGHVLRSAVVLPGLNNQP